jgi:hypothetical protein
MLESGACGGRRAQGAESVPASRAESPPARLLLGDGRADDAPLRAPLGDGLADEGPIEQNGFDWPARPNRLIGRGWAILGAA